jgi:hypothetical protein
MTNLNRASFLISWHVFNACTQSIDKVVDFSVYFGRNEKVKNV